MTAADDPKIVAEVRASCTRFLSLHPPVGVHEWLGRLAATAETGSRPDLYGEGDAVQELEGRVAALLGKPAGRFVIKGVIAQQAALRAWTERTGVGTVALHPRSHLDHDESNALEQLHPIRALRVGSTAPFTVADLDAVGEPLGAVTVELPLRQSGCLLPTWDQLVEISDWCRAREVPLHIDGARLWESAPHYDRPLADIAALADSVYVSFYKGLGGLGGCVLAGSEEVLAGARPWITRLGGNVFTVFPYVLSAQEGLDRHLPRMAEYAARARSLAAALSELPGVRVAPDPPQTNGFLLYVPGEEAALREAHLELARETGVWLLRFAAAEVPGYAQAEVHLGSAVDDLTDAEVVDLLARIAAAAAPGGVRT